MQMQDTGKPRETKLKENPYMDMRNLAISAKPDQLKLNLDNNTTTVYGVVMDYDMGAAVVTVSAFQTGDASLYLSTGQIFIGGYSHENIKQAGLAFVKEAQNYLPKSKLSESTPLPDKDCIRFYLLTNKGIFFYQETVTNIKNEGSDWTKLFYLANNVITQYRMIDQN